MASGVQQQEGSGTRPVSPHLSLQRDELAPQLTDGEHLVHRLRGAHTRTSETCVPPLAPRPGALSGLLSSLNPLRAAAPVRAAAHLRLLQPDHVEAREQQRGQHRQGRSGQPPRQGVMVVVMLMCCRSWLAVALRRQSNNCAPLDIIPGVRARSGAEPIEERRTDCAARVSRSHRSGNGRTSGGVHRRSA